MGITLNSTGSYFKKSRMNEGMALKWYGYSFIDLNFKKLVTVIIIWQLIKKEPGLIYFNILK